MEDGMDVNEGKKQELDKEMMKTREKKGGLFIAKRRPCYKSGVAPTYYGRRSLSHLELYWKAGREDKKMKVCRGFLRTPSSRWNEGSWRKNLENGILNVPHLRLSEIPESIYLYDPPISIVYIHDNRIETLPEDFFEKLPTLSWLDLRNNLIKVFPGLKSEHNNLRVLNLKGNRLVRLPYSLVLARGMKSLNVDDNPMMDPCPRVVENGTMAIMEYLRVKHFSRASAFDFRRHRLDTVPEDYEYSTDSETDMDIMTGSVSQSPSGIIIDEDHRRKYAMMEDVERANSDGTINLPNNRDIYTMGLWKDVPFESHPAHAIMDRAIRDYRTENERKLKADSETILQRFKDRDFIEKWRESARLRQLHGPHFPIELAQPPFGTDDMDALIQEPNLRKPVKMDEFDVEFQSTLKNLREYAENPVTNITDAQERLTQMEEVRDRLLGMRIEEKPFLPI